MAYNTGSDPTLAQQITAGFNPAMFSKGAIMHTKSALVCANAVNQNWRSQLKYGHTLTIPVFSEATTSEVTPGTRVAGQNLAGTPATITIDQWRQAPVEISDMADIENLADYMAGAQESCGFAISKYIDTTINTLFSTLSSSSPYGNDGQTMTEDIIIAIREGLRAADVPDPEKWAVIGDASMEADMYNIEKFSNSLYGAAGVAQTGMIGKVYGMKVLITQNLTDATSGSYGCILHPDAIGLVMQENPRSQLTRINDEFMTHITVDAIWGVAEIRDAFGKSFYTRSTG